MDANLIHTEMWAKIKEHAEWMNLPENHLKHLLLQPDRLETFSLSGAGLFYDFSRQRIDKTGMKLLLELAEALQVKQMFNDTVRGEIVNTTEKRAALHTATRRFRSGDIQINGQDVMEEIRSVRESFAEFSERIRSGDILGSTGKTFKDAVVIGIGGSYLGTEFVSCALDSYWDGKITLHFLSNVDIHNFGSIVRRIDPERTLWVVISKSYTTAETSANTGLAMQFMNQKGLKPEKHFVTVTAKGSPGDDPSNPVLRSFYMFDYIGGRYSVTSAVGGVPLSLQLGYSCFERFLKGAEEMDMHAETAEPEKNLPLMAALISIWNNNFLHYGTQGIIPYAAPLSRLAPHIQQLYMESNGKAVTREGLPVGVDTGVIIFGEPGTNAQHSFFQLAHQGRPFPIDFIGVVDPGYDYDHLTNGVTNHQELWANLIAQPKALALGKEDTDPHRSFTGNRPSSTIVLKDLSPESVGRLLAFYEARTVYEAFIWGINPFDQFGVELGKKLAKGIRQSMAAKNNDPSYRFDGSDATDLFYLNNLFGGN